MALPGAVVGDVAGTAVLKAFDLECGRVGLLDIDALGVSEEATDVGVGVETVRTLGLAVDDRVEALGDGLVDHRLKLACLAPKVLHLEHLEQEPLDDAVVLERVPGPPDPLLGQVDTFVLLVGTEPLGFEFADHLVGTRRAHVQHIRDRAGRGWPVLHLLHQVDGL